MAPVEQQHFDDYEEVARSVLALAQEINALYEFKNVDREYRAKVYKLTMLPDKTFISEALL